MKLFGFSLTFAAISMASFTLGGQATNWMWLNTFAVGVAAVYLLLGDA